MLLAALAAICIAACGSEPADGGGRTAPSGSARDVAQARAHIKQVVERTARAMVPGRVLDTVLGSYGIQFRVEDGEIEGLFRATADHWRASRMDAGPVDLSIVDPALHATAADGYQYELHFVKRTLSA